MPIKPYLNGQVFQPAQIEAMGIALIKACDVLRLTDRCDPLTEIVATKIIELAAQGEDDPERLCAGALATFKSLEQ